MRIVRPISGLGFLATAAMAVSALHGLGCGDRQASVGSPSPLRDACAKDLRWNGSACVTDRDAQAALAKASEALDAFDVDTALSLLTTTLAKGSYGHSVLISIYEKLGITYAYLKREAEALSAFKTLLALEPGHLLSYTLSPQATFLFERARNLKKATAPTQVELSWPQGLKEDDPIPLTVEVLSDPLSSLHSMALYVRASESERFRRLQFELPKGSGVGKVVLPAADTERESTLELYGSAYDKEGNEVLLWFDAKRPRELPLGYKTPSPWYRKWWVWAAIGGSAALGTGTTVYLLSVPEPETVGGGFVLGG